MKQVTETLKYMNDPDLKGRATTKWERYYDTSEFATKPCISAIIKNPLSLAEELNNIHIQLVVLKGVHFGETPSDHHNPRIFMKRMPDGGYEVVIHNIDDSMLFPEGDAPESAEWMLIIWQHALWKFLWAVLITALGFWAGTRIW
jgi:hypothetical protein